MLTVARAFLKALGQFSDPALRRVVWIGLGGALGVFAALIAGIWFLLARSSLFETRWLETVADTLGGMAALGLAWLFFPAVVGILVCFLLEPVARAVEARHFPDLPPAPGLPVVAAVVTTAKFVAALVVLNLLALVFYLIPVINIFVFYALNGYLLGREYLELVALRRADPRRARALGKAHRGQLFLAGVVIAFLSTLPVVNLLAPVLATAALVHLFEGWRAEPEPARM